MSKHQTPPQYIAPLKTREEITDWIFNLASHRNYDREPWILCFDVKLRSLDLSFDNLVKTANECGFGFDGDLTDPVWLSGCRKKYDDLDQDHLYEWAVEDARGTFSGGDGVHYGKPDDDGYNMLWDGTPVDVEFAFLGRSGGWLVLTHFERIPMTGLECIAEMDFKTLKLLYRYLVMLAADLKSCTPESRVEQAAAFTFFANICANVLTHEGQCAEWALDQSGEHDTIAV